MEPEQWGMLSRVLAEWAVKHQHDGKSEISKKHNATACCVVQALSQVADEMSYQTAKVFEDEIARQATQVAKEK